MLLPSNKNVTTVNESVTKMTNFRKHISLKPNLYHSTYRSHFGRLIMTPHTVDVVQRNRRGRTLDEPTVCLEQTDEVSWFFTRKCAVHSLVKLGIK